MNDKFLKILKNKFPEHYNSGNVFSITTENGKTYNISIKDGKLIHHKDTNENKNIKKALAGLCIIGGMLTSCVKDNSGFGYNIGSRSTEYTLDKGTPNKKVTISTPMGDEEHEVDSTLAKTSFGTAGGGLKVGRPITPTEALIVKIGHAYQTEKNMNNKKGTPANKRWDYNPEQGTLTGGGNYYPDASFEHKTIRTHPLWNLGLEAARKAGKDVQSLLQKADKEVQDQNWIK